MERRRPAAHKPRHQSLKTMESQTKSRAHAVMLARIIEESSFEAVLDLVADQAAQRAALGNSRPTIKQARYRRLGPALSKTIETAIRERI